ncbi:MAG: inositol monophosphatase [Oscillochloris sp.]|nr:inositol monophosphatase [Oscillochloris sp.]
MSIQNREQLLRLIRDLHERIRDAVVAACEQAAVEQLAGVAEDAADGDTIYAVDRVSEAVLLEFFAAAIAPHWPLVLIAEGLPDNGMLLPAGTPETATTIRVIVDPIDGTRGLMYQKRSGWILTGVAPNRGPQTRLSDIELAVMTEIPLVKQHLSDSLWAFSDGPLHGERFNRVSGETQPIHLRPSQAAGLAHGFATVSRFFPGIRSELAAIDDELAQQLLGPPQPGKAQCFEDQYICSAGQLYELIAGHDRFTADLRPLFIGKAGSPGICSHPYDLATMLLAQKAGVLLSDERGASLDAPLDLHSNVGWIGYANAGLRAQIEPKLLAILRARGLV